MLVEFILHLGKLAFVWLRQVESLNFQSNSFVEFDSVGVVGTDVERKGVLRVIDQKVVNHFPTDSLPLAVHSYRNPMQVTALNSLFAETGVPCVARGEYGISQDGTGALLLCHDDFVVGALPELFHDVSSVLLVTRLEGLSINQH